MRELFDARNFGAAIPGARRIVVAAALSAALLHAGHLVYASLAHACAPVSLQCAADAAPWSAGDYGTYRNVARSIRAKGLLGASYILRTPGYPLLLLTAEEAIGGPNAARWFGVLGAAAAAASIAAIAGWLSGSALASLIAAVLFALWWSAYQLSAALQTDGVHAFAALTALALTLRWRIHGGAGRAGLAGLAWMFAQTLRPTFFAVALLLPLLLFVPGADRRRHVVAACLWLSTLIVPSFVMGSNRVQHGVAVPSLIAGVNLRCYAVPRLQEELGLGIFKVRREQCLERFRGMPAAQRVRVERDEALAFFAAHPLPFVASILGEIGEQLSEPLRIHSVPSQARHYPGWMIAASPLLVVFWCAAALGTLRILRLEPWLGLFVAGWFALVMLPAATAHFTGGRLRFPLDLLAIPVVAALLSDALHWLRERSRSPTPADPGVAG